MTGLEVFQNFEVMLPEGKRYWEDESTGLVLKRGQTADVGPRQFRSAELRFALIRSQVLMKTGECKFAFRAQMVNIKPGENGKNIVMDIKEDQNETEKKPIKEDVVIPKVKKVKEEKISEV